jgi:hypothetical protein
MVRVIFSQWTSLIIFNSRLNPARQNQRNFTLPVTLKLVFLGAALRRQDAACSQKAHLETGGAGILPKTPEDYARNIATMRKHIERAAAMGSPLCRFVLAASQAALPPGPAEKHLETAVKMLLEVRSQVLDSRLKIAIEVHKDFRHGSSRNLLTRRARTCPASISIPATRFMLWKTRCTGWGRFCRMR